MHVARFITLLEANSGLTHVERAYLWDDCTKCPIVQRYDIVEAFCINVERNLGQFGSLKDDIRMHRFGQKIILLISFPSANLVSRAFPSAMES